MKHTHTYVVLELSTEAFKEIADKLVAAGYAHTFMNTGEIDMHGIAVADVNYLREPTLTAGPIARLPE